MEPQLCIIMEVQPVFALSYVVFLVFKNVTIEIDEKKHIMNSDAKDLN